MLADSTRRVESDCAAVLVAIVSSFTLEPRCGSLMRTLRPARAASECASHSHSSGVWLTRISGGIGRSR